MFFGIKQLIFKFLFLLKCVCSRGRDGRGRAWLGTDTAIFCLLAGWNSWDWIVGKARNQKHHPAFPQS